MSALYKTQFGDTYEQISKDSGVPLDALFIANPQITNKNMLVEGKYIKIPLVLTRESLKGYCQL